MRKALLAIILLYSAFDLAADNETIVSLTKQEQELYDLIMTYRRENGLPTIPISPSLTYVAQTHVRDLHDFPPQDPKCNLHSWSANGDWSSCCYTRDHEKAKCMWNKPRELTQYQGAGYEIAHMSSSGVTPWGALKSWKNSLPHDSVILNIGRWKLHEWQAIGVGIYENYAVVWFGEEPEPVSTPKIESVQASTDPEDALQAYVKQQKTGDKPIQQVGTLAVQKSLIDNSQKGHQEEMENLKLQIEQEKYQYKLELQRNRNKERRERYITRQRRRAELNNGSNFLDRYFDYSGYSFLGIISAGYTYSFIDNRHLLTASILDFRTTLFGASPMAVEMSISPWDTRVAYKPTIRVYIPATKLFSIAPYAGTTVDMSGIGKFFAKGYDYNKSRDFYVNAIAGVALNVSVLKHVPFEIKAEYRHPIISPTRVNLNSKGFYLSAQIYIGCPIRKK